jgi:hypothetical protein
MIDQRTFCSELKPEMLLKIYCPEWMYAVICVFAGNVTTTKQQPGLYLEEDDKFPR